MAQMLKEAVQLSKDNVSYFGETICGSFWAVKTESKVPLFVKKILLLIWKKL